MLLLSRCYLSMRHSDQFNSSLSLYLSSEDLFIIDGGGRVNVGVGITHFFSTEG